MYWNKERDTSPENNLNQLYMYIHVCNIIHVLLYIVIYYMYNLHVAK